MSRVRDLFGDASPADCDAYRDALDDIVHNNQRAGSYSQRNRNADRAAAKLPPHAQRAIEKGRR